MSWEIKSPGMALLLTESSPLDLMPMQKIPVTSKPIYEVTPSDFTCCNESGCIRYRLTYQYGPLKLSIVTMPPNKSGIHGNLGLAADPTTYEVMCLASGTAPQSPMDHMTWEQIVGFVRYHMAWYSEELDEFENPVDNLDDYRGY
tara:strand:- start:729 stop:1163 length:435 start_codon:yes stop_codon:yes gene_type:complete